MVLMKKTALSLDLFFQIQINFIGFSNVVYPSLIYEGNSVDIMFHEFIWEIIVGCREY